MPDATLDIRQTILTNPGFTPVEVAPAASAPSMTTGFLSRPHVLEAAAACFEELGYDGLTIRALAGRLGCSVGSIYRYFTDKRELLLSCCSRVLEPVAEALENQQLDFDASVALYIQQATMMSEQYRLMFWLCSTPERLPVLDRILKAWTALLGDAGEVRRRWAMLHGMLVIGEDAQHIGRMSAVETHDFAVKTVAAPTDVVNAEPAAEADDVTLL